MHKLTDDGIALLGNALALGYAVTKVVRRQSGLAREEIYQDRLETTEIVELREALQSAGCYDYRLAHPEGYWARTHQSIGDFENWILEFVTKDEEINRIRIKDIELPAAVSENYGIDFAITAAGPYELRTPISSLGPTALTRTFRKLVLDYLKHRMPPHLLALLPEHSGTPVYKRRATQSSDTTQEKRFGQRRYNAGFEETDKPFVEEGVQMVRSNEFASALAAARKLVYRYETISPDEWEPDSKCIRTNSPENTVARLAKKINKQLSNSGK